MWRSRSDFAGPRGAGAPFALVLASLRICLAFASFLWLSELGWSLRASAKLGLARAQGLCAGLGLSLLLALCAGLLLGVLRVLASPRVLGEQDVVWGPRVQRFLFADEPPHDKRVGGLLGVLPPLAFFALAGFLLTRRTILGMVRPHFAAITIVAIHLGLALLALGLYPASRNVGTLLARALGRLPLLRYIFGRAGGMLFALLAASLGGAAFVTHRFWSTFSFLPWRNISGLFAAVLFTGLSLWLAQFSVLRIIGRASLLVLLVTALAALLTLDPHGERAKGAVVETLGGRAGQSIAMATLDFDHDGYLGMFGGGDCAPWNPRVNPAALDIPNNHRDEDCDGADLTDAQMGVKLRRDWPVPAGFPEHPNVLLVTIDTFAAGHMQGAGYKRKVTPNLDAFAQQSAFFRDCFSQGPSTRLSFPSIFTSRWDSQIKKRLAGGHPYPIDASELMLAEVLEQSGYETAAVIPDNYFKPAHWGSLTAGFQHVIDSPLRVKATHNSAAVTDAALAVLRQPRQKPLFLWVHYYDAHSPFSRPPGGEDFGKKEADIYDSELHYVDQEVGRLLQGAAADGAAQPLVFVTGDHGIAFDAPRHVEFNYGYDLTTIVLNVPLIVHGPQVVPHTSDAIVSTMDIAPTIVNLLRIPPPPPFEGASLLPELLEAKRTRPQRLIHEFFIDERILENGEPLEQISLRTERYDLIHDRKHGTFELYDWRKDYREARNLADEPDLVKTLVGLKQQLALATYELYEGERQKAARALGRR
jgi:arylsulfatase A-like enzyme